MNQTPENPTPPSEPKKEAVPIPQSLPTGDTNPTSALKPEPTKPPTSPTEPILNSTKPINISEAIAAPMDRRSFIKWGTIGWTAFAAVVGGYLTMVLRYLFPNVLFEPVQTFRAGFPEDYQTGEVSERWKDRYAIWLVRSGNQIYALSTVCTHLGCTPNWLANDNKFKCPCHGSGFYKTGINFEGPAPRPLERFRISLSDTGEIMVDKTKKFQQEKGEWKDPESFIAV